MTGVTVVVAVLVLVIVLPVYFTVIKPGSEDNSDTHTSKLIKFDCYPDGSPTQKECEDRGCAWNSIDPTVPSCFYNGSGSYTLLGNTSVTNNEISSKLSRRSEAKTHFGTQFPELSVTTTYISSSSLRIKIAPEEYRYEVPFEHPTNIEKPSDAAYSVEHVNENGRFGVRVTRLATSKVIFDTSVGEMMFADQFLQISTKVASEYLYGFGEHMHSNFKHDMNWKSYGMFSRDQWVQRNSNLYGVHPYFMCMEGDGNAYSVLFVNSNAMDVSLQPTPAITYHSIGGLLDFYIFLGPTPEQVTQQYTDVIGKPFLPPYWSLGFQLCRYGYENLDNLTRVVNRNLGRIPYEIQYSDIDYMERQLDFTIDQVAYNGLEDFVRNLKADNKMRYIIILDPAISGNETAGTYPPFDNGVRDNVFIKTADNEIAWGKVWPDYPGIDVNTSQDWDYQTANYRAFAAFPDFYHPNTTKWWKDLTVDFHNSIEFDGLWIDMNEPASFVHGSPVGCPEGTKYDDTLPYYPKGIEGNGVLYDKTICMQNKQYHPTENGNTEHYNVHSIYGLSQSLPTLEACRESTGERCVVISRSTYPGSGKYAGHWLGDNNSDWDHLANSIIGLLEFNLFGIPYIGADVCGFFSDVTRELCLRWMQLGAFYPFDRNHNGIGQADQDPGAFDEGFVNASRKVLNTRYTLLPYLYTLLYDAHLTGKTVVRSLLSEFPNDVKTYTIDEQFMWGSGLLISPTLKEGATAISAYFPTARWYHYETGKEIPGTANGGFHIVLLAPLEHINLHLHGGNIIPTQEPALTTFYSRQNPFGLIVALNEKYRATGKMFWDDGTSTDTIENNKYTLLSFNADTASLDITIAQPASEDLDVSGLFFNKIRISGLPQKTINTVVVDKIESQISVNRDFQATYGNNTLEITRMKLYLNTTHKIEWR